MQAGEIHDFTSAANSIGLRHPIGDLFLITGFGSSVLNHSPLKAFTSQFDNSTGVLESTLRFKLSQLTVVNDFVGIMKVYSVIRIRKYMNVVILHASKIQLVQ